MGGWGMVIGRDGRGLPVWTVLCVWSSEKEFQFLATCLATTLFCGRLGAQSARAQRAAGTRAPHAELKTSRHWAPGS